MRLQTTRRPTARAPSKAAARRACRRPPRRGKDVVPAGSRARRLLPSGSGCKLELLPRISTSTLWAPLDFVSANVPSFGANVLPVDAAADEVVVADEPGDQRVSGAR